MNVLGIDPGVEGALALLDGDGAILGVWDMPTIEIRVAKTTRPRIATAELVRLLRGMDIGHAALEFVQGRPTDVPTRAGELCRTAGIIEGIVVALGIPATMVQPQAWRKAMGVSLPPGSTSPQRKEASRQRALQLYPDRADLFARKLDSDRAEATLIARWALLFDGVIRHSTNLTREAA